MYGWLELFKKFSFLPTWFHSTHRAHYMWRTTIFQINKQIYEVAYDFSIERKFYFIQKLTAFPFHRSWIGSKAERRLLERIPQYLIHFRNFLNFKLNLNQQFCRCLSKYLHIFFIWWTIGIDDYQMTVFHARIIRVWVIYSFMSILFVTIPRYAE